MAFPIACALVLLLTATGGEESRDELSFRTAGVEYAVEYVPYAEPRVLDLEQATGAWSTPWNALLSYHAAMLSVETIDEFREHQRLDDGSPAPAHMQDEQLVAAARDILAGDVTIYGEVAWDDTTIFLYRYERGVPALGGLPFRRFDGEYRLVKDLTVQQPLFRELSVADWDVPAVHASFGVEAPPGSVGWFDVRIVALGAGLAGLLLASFLIRRRSR